MRIFIISIIVTCSENQQPCPASLRSWMSHRASCRYASCKPCIPANQSKQKSDVNCCVLIPTTSTHLLLHPYWGKSLYPEQEESNLKSMRT